MATPNVSGIATILKSAHHDLSPAAVKLAMVTRAWYTDPSREQIFAEGDTILRLADPYDISGGIVNPNVATVPGLGYDINTVNSAHYLCFMGYNATTISQLLGEKQQHVPGVGLSLESELAIKDHS